MTRYLLSLPLLATLAACGGSAPLYTVEPPVATAPVRLAVSTIELRDVVLPAYAEETAILLEASDGGLAPLKGAAWADGTRQGVTAQLARALDLRSSASVAAEPWPLNEPAALRLEVRIDRLVARQDGRFQVTGQFAGASSMGQMRDFLQRFDISVPMAGSTPADVATAYGAAIGKLSDEILARLRRR